MVLKLHTFFHYLNIPPGRLERRIDSLSSLGNITCEWKASSSQPTIFLDVIAVYPCFPKLLLYVGWLKNAPTQILTGFFTQILIM